MTEETKIIDWSEMMNKFAVHQGTIVDFCKENNLKPYQLYHQRNKLKILHFDEGFWLYYYRLEKGKFKWPITKEDALNVNLEELRWLLKGYEVRTQSKFKPIISNNYY